MSRPDSRCTHRTLLLAVAFALISWGCSRTPARVEAPSLDASAIASGAMTKYDQNGDGQVGGDELEAAPSLKAALGDLDKDGNGSVSADEIEQRVNAWLESKLGITTVTCSVTLDGAPLAGAQITFEPEPFLGAAVKPATGTTDASGMAILSIPASDLPNPNMSGAQVGLYIVRISKQQAGQESIPAKYNTASTLGAEVAIDSAGLREGYPFKLTRK
ncbi:MAG: hypothetical protein KDA42_17035 [Planctomycetales bacterium]|nr:hypothetical protein [Planctomycetales bacterium]